MKKIMFSDKHGLTAAVLAGTKTQTRRIINAMPKDPKIAYGLEDEAGYVHLLDGYIVVAKSKFNVGEVVAVAQSYFDIKTSANSYRPPIWKGYKDWHKYLDTLPTDGAGYHNKMFVKSELMPNHIRIENIRVERLQDISDKDCLAEGIVKYSDGVYTYIEGGKKYYHRELDTPQKAYGVLINKIYGLGTWMINPWVFVYNFKLVKKNEQRSNRISKT